MKTINDVEAYWNSNPCGAAPYFNCADKEAAFRAIEKERYEKQAGILKYGRFGSFKGERVLEIGCGIGTDGIQFAKNGAIYTGVDLTEASVNAAREQLLLFGQKGEIIKINAEGLPFCDNHFDHVYSFGVIHHSPYPEKIVEEIYRVLKPGGTLTVMLYNKTSFYYLLEMNIIRRMFFWVCDKRRFCNMAFSWFSGGRAARFEAFRKKLEAMKRINKKPAGDEWISMNTDDVFCPIARVYSRSDAKKLFSKFRDFKSEVWFIDKENWFLWLVLARCVPKTIERWLESNFGWFRMIEAEKGAR